jgi:hypothetical protein
LGPVANGGFIFARLALNATIARAKLHGLIVETGSKAARRAR